MNNQESVATTPATEEQAGQEELAGQTGQTEQVEQQEDQIKGKQSNWVPRYRLNEKNEEIKRLNAELEELKGLKGKADVYDSLAQLLEDNPEYASELNQLYQKHFGKEQKSKSDDSLFEGEDEYDTRLKNLEKIVQEQRKENLAKEWKLEMQEVFQDAKKRGVNISETEIYEIMNKAKLYSPKEAYNLWMGRQIDHMRSLWEASIRKDTKEKSQQFPSISSKTKGIGKPPQSLEEAFNLLIN